MGAVHEREVALGWEVGSRLTWRVLLWPQAPVLSFPRSLLSDSEAANLLGTWGHAHFPWAPGALSLVRKT